jgi:uncharacterized protein YbjT (DUF2867 family)
VLLQVLARRALFCSTPRSYHNHTFRFPSLLHAPREAAPENNHIINITNMSSVRAAAAGPAQQQLTRPRSTLIASSASAPSRRCRAASVAARAASSPDASSPAGLVAAAASSAPSRRRRASSSSVAARAAASDASSDTTLADQLAARGINTVAVAGATGGVGSAVVRALLAASSAPSPSPPSLRVRALARSESKAATVLPPFGANSQLSVAVADVEQFATLPSALKGADALVIATGPPRTMNPLGPYEVDYQGNLNLFAAAKQSGTVKHVVFVTSIGADDFVNPLNLFFLILFWKKQAEAALQRSGLPYTIIRPGGLKDSGPPGGIVLGGPGTWGVPPLKVAGSILRSQVADLVVAALAAPEASAGKVVEAIAKEDAPARPATQLLAEV